jgi:RimJ/RimL family protein N-acetyltransferase
MKSLSGQRLILRRWRESDLEPFSVINADPIVMEFYPRTFSLKETRAAIEKIEADFDSHGFGLWALELRKTSRFIGYVGLSRPTFQAHFTPCIEIGWRISKEHWGKGFATEAAREVIRDAFERLQLGEVVSYTAAVNARSIRVMEKISMLRNKQDDFLHPLIEDDHPLKPHVLFRLPKIHWLSLVSGITDKSNISNA